MIQNSKIEERKWYRHPGMLDTAIKVLHISEGKALILWFNISGGKRKFLLDSESVSLEVFKNSPYWQDQGDWIDKLPTIFS